MLIFYFEETVDSRALIRNNVENLCTLCPVSSCGKILQIIVQFYNQDIELNTVKIQRSSNTTGVYPVAL